MVFFNDNIAERNAVEYINQVPTVLFGCSNIQSHTEQVVLHFMAHMWLSGCNNTWTDTTHPI